MKNYLGKLLKAATDSDYRFQILASRGFYNNMSDGEYLKRLFKARMGYPLDLDNPQTFNEKLQWLKIHDRKPEYTAMVDKYAVKKYVADKIGEKYVIPTLGVWDRFDDIDFDSLPDQFVLKCTHDSGGLVICRNKSEFDVKAAKKKITKCMNRNYYWSGREYPYKNVTRKILAEEYMEDESQCELNDYKLMCFNGKVKCSFVCSNRFSDIGLHVTFFDREWSVMPFERHYPYYPEGLPKPANYETMIQLAEKLACGLIFIRCDFYEVNGKIYFGELTFYPGSGMEEFVPEEWDYIIGEYLNLSFRNKGDKDD